MIKKYLPVVAFFAGFIWDALTIGKNVNASDLLILSAYLFGTVPIMVWLVKRANLLINNAAQTTLAMHVSFKDANWRERLPYLLLQFLFGSLFSALFILYFKSSSHLAAFAWCLGLGVLLIANEFLETAYRRFTLIWTLFGFSLILLLNFVLPYSLGSIHWLWFFVSIILAVVITQALKLKISPHLGSIYPTYLIAILIASIYVLDVIPPVPLVIKDIQVGTHLEKVSNTYKLQQDKAPAWRFWRSTSNSVHIVKGEKVYCISSVFAPSNLETRLYHRWQMHDKKQGWVTMSRIGFALTGGRNKGYRGYTYKQNVAFGLWRVKVETENGRTISVHEFTINNDKNNQNKVIKVI
ncbi:MAG: hypothetical protein CTY27_02800 [Methylotenera sp.]|nr:MAG: hypothetical protein BVN34_01970 [Proteobacteria bacterium ST_bin12]PPD17947.1 MAG: hypothetical protein CTY27_02800 [Methylotenera sp.]